MSRVLEVVVDLFCNSPLCPKRVTAQNYLLAKSVPAARVSAELKRLGKNCVECGIDNRPFLPYRRPS